MKNKGTLADIILRGMELEAELNANKFCKGFIYEPDVPKKLKKTSEK